jgi:hypothetical protein
LKLYRVDLTETRTTHIVLPAPDERTATITALAKVHIDPDWFGNPDSKDTMIMGVEEIDGSN